MQAKALAPSVTALSLLTLAAAACGSRPVTPTPAPVWPEANVTAAPAEAGLDEMRVTVEPFVALDRPEAQAEADGLRVLLLHLLAHGDLLVDDADNARWVLRARLTHRPEPTPHLRLVDRAAGALHERTATVDAPRLWRPRFALMGLLDAAERSPRPRQRGHMGWTEELDAAGLARVGAFAESPPDRAAAVGLVEALPNSYVALTEAAGALPRDDEGRCSAERERWLGRALLLHPGGYRAASLLSECAGSGSASTLARMLRGDGGCAVSGKGLMGSVGLRKVTGVGVVTGIGGVYNGSQCGANRALPLLAQAAKMAKTPLARAAALNELGLARQLGGDLDGALEALSGAVAARREVGWAPGLALSLLRLGDLRLARGENPAAVAAMGEALKVARAADDPHLAARIVNSLGLADRARGAWDEAIDRFRRARDAFEDLGDASNVGVALSNLGGTWILLGRYAQAIPLLERALALKKQTSLSGGVAVQLTNLGTALRALGRTDEARERFEAAGELAEDDVSRATIANDLGEVAAAAGRTEEAAAAYDKALALARRLGDKTTAGLVRHNRGELALSQGDLDEAKRELEGALFLRRAVGDRAGEGLTLTSLMAMWRRWGDTAAAIFYGKLAIEAHQEVRAHAAAAGDEAQRAFVRTRERAYRQLAELLVEAGRLEEAEAVMGLLKQEELDRWRRRSSGGDGPGLPLTDNERDAAAGYRDASGEVMAVARQYLALSGKAVLSGEERARLEALEAKLEAANGAFSERLDALISELDLGRGADLSDAVLGIGPDLAELPDGTVAVFTLVSDDALHSFVVGPEGRAAAQAAVPRAKLARLVTRFREALQDPSSDPRPLARQLYDMLVAPIAGHLERAGAKTIMWSLDRTLRYVPLAALHDGERWLAERWRTVVFTPASRARLDAKPQRPWRALGAGVSRATSRFEALPAVPEELDRVIDDDGTPEPDGALPGVVLLDDGFTFARFRDELRRRRPVVHIATHFELLPGDKEASVLLLGDGELKLSRIERLPNLFRGVDLLTLSACDTAVGGDDGGGGEELESFAAMAQQKGARAVLATLWPVADESTSLLMRRFYELQRAQPELPKIEALRAAQLELLRGPYSHPYHWAPFVLIGNWL